MDKFVSSGKAAKLLGVSPSTIVIWEKEGRIIAIRTPGGRRRFKVEDIEKLKEYVSPAVAAEMLGVSTQALRCWAEAGKIRAIRRTGKRMYSLEDLRGILGAEKPS